MVTLVRPRDASGKWAQMTFDPAQPRNEGGEWTSGGGSGGASTISVDDEDRAEIDRRSKAATGRKLSDQELAGLVGAPKGSTVKISLDNDRYRPGISIVAEHPDIEDQAVARLQTPTQTPRDLEMGRTSPAELHYEQVFLKPEARGKGTGVKMLADAVEAAHQAGIQKVTMDAVGAGPKGRFPTHPGADEGENGYYVWPRLGFDGPLSGAGVSAEPKKWPEPFKSATNVSDLMRMPGGAQHWKDYGDEIGLSMDTNPGSPGRQIMDAYVKHRGL